MTNNDLFKSIQNILYTICVYSNLILANARNGYGKIIFVRGFLFLPFLQAILLQLSDVMRDSFLLFAAIRFKSGLLPGQSKSVYLSSFSLVWVAQNSHWNLINRWEHPSHSKCYKMKLKMYIQAYRKQTSC